MIDTTALISFVLACIAIIVVPGPSVTVIVANSLRAGSRAGLANVAGTQLGLIMMIIILALGLDVVVENLGHVFTYLKLVGAAYLIWLGYKLLRSNSRLAKVDPKLPVRSLSGYFWQGFLVIWSNPKALFFFGAFIPQFIDPVANAALQTLVLGSIFMVLATVFDSIYALAAGKAGSWLTKGKVRWVERISGTCLIGGGLWLAFSKKA